MNQFMKKEKKMKSQYMLITDIAMKLYNRVNLPIDVVIDIFLKSTYIDSFDLELGKLGNMMPSFFS